MLNVITVVIPKTDLFSRNPQGPYRVHSLDWLEGIWIILVPTACVNFDPKAIKQNPKFFPSLSGHLHQFAPTFQVQIPQPDMHKNAK
jgi:hypothetical protein